jgi:spectinomycin phosphotransferase/16S rRNA (guanine(1405)-N(7))-methyltransferase
MLSPPAGLIEADLALLLHSHWSVRGARLEYRPVGFGSHHWAAVDKSGRRWFVTVDDLEVRRSHRTEELGSVNARLEAALTGAIELRESGLEFVIAPLRAADGCALVPIGDRYVVALYPSVDGQSFGWGHVPTGEETRALLALLARLHDAIPPSHLQPERVAARYRDVLENPSVLPMAGPYSKRLLQLLNDQKREIKRALARYDYLSTGLEEHKLVATHGEPHPGNTMLTARGLVLIDWDTARLAPRERDLWSLDAGDGSTFAAYSDRTGQTLSTRLLEFYRLRWDIEDVGAYLAHFSSAHGDSEDDRKSWEEIHRLLSRL